MLMLAYKVGIEILVTLSQFERGHRGQAPRCICLGPEQMRALSSYMGSDVDSDGIRFKGIPVQSMDQDGIVVLGE